MKSNIYFYSVPIILFFITSCQPKKTVIELPEIEEQEVSENTEPLPQNSMIDTDDDFEDESIYLSMTGNLVSSEDTGQGPFYGVSIKNNRGNFYFWVEASSTPEVYKWELDYFDNDFNIYKDTLIHISYTEELTLEVIDVSPKGTSNSKGKFYSGTLEGMYDAGDTPGSIDLIIESGETISFRGNFDIESSPEVEQLIGEQVEIYYDIDTVRWINDLGYVKITSQEQQLRIVTFNYDLRLHNAIFQHGRYAFGLNDADAKRFVDSIPIVSIYGTIGKLNWQDPSGQRWTPFLRQVISSEKP